LGGIYLPRRLTRFLCAICFAGAINASLAACTEGEAVGTSTGVPAQESEPPDIIPAAEIIPPPSPTPLVYEAEDALLGGGARIESTLNGYTGGGYATGFENDGDYAEFTVSIEEAGFYDLNFITATGSNGYKENYIAVNGETVGTASVESEGFTDSVLKRIYFDAGEVKVRFVKFWGWVYLDSLVVTPSLTLGPDVYNISPKLINPNATGNAKRLMTYLTDIYGKYILTGQYSDLGLNGHELYTIQLATGEKPAVLGLDLIEYTPSRVLNGSEGRAVERAIEFYEAGGVVTLCWHWNAPEDYLTGLWYRGFYTDATNIRLNKIMNGTDQNGYELLLRDIDAIAARLKELQDADVPVLWRPLHEASGGWFWWGAAGPEAYIKLWKLMYDRLTNHHGLNNLIWLWNGQSADWYPGEEYVDIIGEDIYAGEHVYSPQTGKFTEIFEYSGGRKMIVLSEIGTLFDPELAARDNTMWGFYATWSGEFVLAGQGLNILSEKYTEKDMLIKMYAHEKTLSLSDLPDLKTYQIKESD
jgi:mannan endo-1,4-beta-mannosidase